MDYSGLSGILFTIQIAIIISAYTIIYYPIKEAESKLIGEKSLTRIKRYLFKLIIRDVRSLLNPLWIFTLFSLFVIILLLANKFEVLGLFLIFSILFLLFSISLGEMIRYYYKYIIKRKNIVEANDTKKILEIFEIKKGYLNKLDKFINEAISKKNPKEDDLLKFILDGIYYYEDGKITELKDKK